MNLKDTLKTIIPGETYPSSVTIKEKEGTVRFNLQSYFVGMYAAIYFPNEVIPQQTGDHNNKTFVSKLLRDIKSATKRGAKVEIGPVLPVKNHMDSLLTTAQPSSTVTV